eukprot:5503161-Amphidinium_carterae.1
MNEFQNILDRPVIKNGGMVVGLCTQSAGLDMAADTKYYHWEDKSPQVDVRLQDPPKNDLQIGCHGNQHDFTTIVLLNLPRLSTAQMA